jgi:hypothetical protein
MIEIRRLNAHDPVPEGRNVVVLRRFDEDDPHKTITEILVTHRSGLPETARPHLDMPAILEAAQRVAEEEGVKMVQVIDRTAGPRERDIMQHGGDRSVHGDRLVDDDLDEGTRGPDMRDRGTHDPEK